MMKYFFSVFVLLFSLSVVPPVYADTHVYFSPNGGCQQAVIAEINEARRSIDLAMYSITSREIAQAILKAKGRDVKIKIVLDKSQISEHSSKSRFLMSNGVNVKFHLGPGLMHDKFAVIDSRVVLTGSFNWTFSADKKNSENLLVIHDRDLAQKYAKEFRHLWKQSGEGEVNRKLVETKEHD